MEATGTDVGGSGRWGYRVAAGRLIVDIREAVVVVVLALVTRRV
jgi:hypothetical protein